MGCCGTKGGTQSDSTKVAQPHTKTRTSNHAPLRIRCSQRITSEGSFSTTPVKLIIFDLDETITMATFMPKDLKFKPHMNEFLKKYNFESPFVEGSRIAKLQSLFGNLCKRKDGKERSLAILTRNEGGVVAVVELLKTAHLDKYFSAIWAMPSIRPPSAPCGAYQEGRTWKTWDPPVTDVHDHKADVIEAIAKNPKDWFPQLAKGTKGSLADLLSLRLEGIVLVDDQRHNFQSDSGAKVLRYCKVARYEADYRDVGVIENMGGIGAHSDADYETLRRFVEDPWMCQETLQVRCNQREMLDVAGRDPVKLVVFDFDETLTMSTFMPADPACAEKVGWVPSDEAADDWSREELVEYNFQSPFISTGEWKRENSGAARLGQLMNMLRDLANGTSGERRILAVLTRNDSGVRAVLNLLKIAGLDVYFSAIWTIPFRQDSPNGAYRDAGQWVCWEPPVDPDGQKSHKADVLAMVAQKPELWFPQLEKGECQELRGLTLQNIVLVDDERANFRSVRTNAMVLRYCKVARYDDDYRDCGLLNQLGGIGSHSDEDYKTLIAFCNEPWEYPYEKSPMEMSATDTGPGTFEITEAVLLSKSPSTVTSEQLSPRRLDKEDHREEVRRERVKSERDKDKRTKAGTSRTSPSSKSQAPVDMLPKDDAADSAAAPGTPGVPALDVDEVDVVAM